MVQAMVMVLYDMMIVVGVWYGMGSGDDDTA